MQGWGYRSWLPSGILITGILVGIFFSTSVSVPDNFNLWPLPWFKTMMLSMVSSEFPGIKFRWISCANEDIANSIIKNKILHFFIANKISIRFGKNIIDVSQT
jgi:hypothetical protein